MQRLLNAAALISSASIMSTTCVSAGRPTCALPVRAPIAYSGPKRSGFAKPRGVGAPPDGHVGRGAATNIPAEHTPLARPWLRVGPVQLAAEVEKVSPGYHGSPIGDHTEIIKGSAS